MRDDERATPSIVRALTCADAVLFAPPANDDEDDEDEAAMAMPDSDAPRLLSGLPPLTSPEGDDVGVDDRSASAMGALSGSFVTKEGADSSAEDGAHGSHTSSMSVSMAMWLWKRLGLAS